MLDALWNRVEFLGDLRKHRIARWIFLLWAAASVYDTFGSQFLPDDWAQKRPTVYQLVVMTTGWLPWQAWLLIGAIILVIFAIEYAARQKQQLVVPGPDIKSPKMSVPIIGMILCAIGFVAFFVAWQKTSSPQQVAKDDQKPIQSATISEPQRAPANQIQPIPTDAAIFWAPASISEIVQVENSNLNGDPMVTVLKMYGAKNTAP
jgi:hypothetical protein